MVANVDLRSIKHFKTTRDIWHIGFLAPLPGCLNQYNTAGAEINAPYSLQSQEDVEIKG